MNVLNSTRYFAPVHLTCFSTRPLQLFASAIVYTYQSALCTTLITTLGWENVWFGDRNVGSRCDCACVGVWDNLRWTGVDLGTAAGVRQ